MAFALPELLNNVFNFLAKDNALYPTLLVSRLWSRCTGPILWGRIELIGEKYLDILIYGMRLLKQTGLYQLLFQHDCLHTYPFPN